MDSGAFVEPGVPGDEASDGFWEVEAPGAGEEPSGALDEEGESEPATGEEGGTSGKFSS